MNSDLPPNKILDIYTNVNKINREKDENNDNNLKIQKSDEKKINDEKHSIKIVDGIEKIDEKHVKDGKKIRTKVLGLVCYPHNN